MVTPSVVISNTHINSFLKDIKELSLTFLIQALQKNDLKQGRFFS